MSRWHLTHDIAPHQRAESICRAAGLRVSGSQSCDGRAYLTAYLKRAVDTPTFVELDDGDWICSAGTLIWKGALGAQALRALHSEFKLHGVTFVQNEALGHYAIAVKSGAEITLFTDPQGALSLYYWFRGTSWSVSTCLQTCAASLSSRRVDPQRFLVTVFQSAAPGEQTLYAEVSRLFGSQSIRIDLHTGTFRVTNIEPAAGKDLTDYRSAGTLEQALERYVTDLRGVFKGLAAVGPVALLGTGGLDSRTVLSGLLDQGVSPALCYGIGNTNLTDDHARDSVVAQQVAQTAGSRFSQLDWSGSQPHSDETLRKLFAHHGFQYEIYGATRGFLKTFTEGVVPGAQLILGGYGPAWTNHKPWESSQTSFSFEELIAYWLAPQATSKHLVDTEGYVKAYAADLRAALSHAHTDWPQDCASLSSFVRTALFIYLRPESRFLNLANEFVHYLCPFILKTLHDPLLNMPLQYRVRDQFQLRLIHELAPRLLDVPLYSGGRSGVLDRNTFQMTPQPPPKFVPTAQSVAGRVADKALPAKWREPVARVYRRLRGGLTREDRSNEVVRVYSQRLARDPLTASHLRDIGSLPIKLVARLQHYLAGVNALGNS